MTIITEFNCDRCVYKTNTFHPHTHTFVHLLSFSLMLHIFIDFQSSILSMSTYIDFSTLPIIDLVHPTRHYTNTKRIKLKCSRCHKAKRKTEVMHLPKLPLQDISNIIENGVKLSRTCDACSDNTKIYGQKVSCAKAHATPIAKDIEYTAAITMYTWRRARYVIH